MSLARLSESHYVTLKSWACIVSAILGVAMVHGCNAFFILTAGVPHNFVS
jgi:hypothetical protein